ncbi:uncharacterized protein N7498_004007, partial [Penicillium cinerascens]
TSGVTPPPTCLLCGIELPQFVHSGISNMLKPELFRKDRWKKYWKQSPKHVMVPSTELEEAYLSDFPLLGSCFCRANSLTITVMKESESSYHLTGINQILYRQDEPLHTPNDPAMARIGGKTNARYDNLHFTSFYAANIGRRPVQFHGKKIGYIVHAYCWVLFERVLETKLTQRNLARFVRTSRKYWRNNELWGLRDDRISEVEPNQNLSSPELGYDDIYQNPLATPAVQKAIDIAKVEAERSDYCLRKTSFPLEISVLIAEWVCPLNYTENDINNTKNMLLAFQWKLPDFFWRARLNEFLFVELDELKKAKFPVDWQVLRLGLMRLVSDRKWYLASGLGDRERVLGIMVDIKKAYLEKS